MPTSGDDPAAASRGGLRLPDQIGACLFDLDGVLTETARVHARAWKQMFDDYLSSRAEREGTAFHPFALPADYEASVDGKPRYDGVRDFLASRAISLPEGDPADAPATESVCGLGNRKNELFRALLRERPVETYAGSIEFVRAVRARGLGTAVVSASANCRAVLAAAGIEGLFDVRVDGETLAREHLRGKPAPDSFLAAASRLGVDAARAAVFEDAIAGVRAARSGEFGFVVAVDRHGDAAALRADGADVVVSDLSELLA